MFKVNFLRNIFLMLQACIGLSVYSFEEIHSLQDLVALCTSDKKVLVVLDIDNVLLRPLTDLGSDQWFYAHVQDYIDKNMSFHEALDKVLPLHFHINHTIDLIPTHDRLVDEVKLLQQHATTVFCLTARSQEIMERTIHQLHTHSMLFNELPTAIHSISVEHPIHAHSGVVFVGKNNKGKVLLEVIHRLDYVPDLVIFVDDKMSNLQTVHDVFIQQDIPYKLFRYALCDELVKNYNHELTQKELEEFLQQHPLIMADAAS